MMPTAQRFNGIKSERPFPSPVLYFIITRPLGVLNLLSTGFGKVRMNDDELLHETIRERNENEEST